MEIEIEELFKGKGTKIKDKEYFPTEAYVTPFIERMSKLTSNFIIKVKPADQISLTKEGEINFDDIVYNRVWVQAVLPGEYCYDNHVQSISMLYGLDTRKPVVKLFSNAVNQACLNMCVFNPLSLSVAELEPVSAIDYKPLKRIMEAQNDIKVTLENLANREITRNEMFNELGHWVDNCINAKFNNGFGTVKLAESLPVEAYKDIWYNEKSAYYTTDDRIDGFTCYNAFTDIISNDKDKDIINKFEKILLIKQIMGIK
jgi:hypothetical protein